MHIDVQLTLLVVW